MKFKICLIILCIFIQTCRSSNLKDDFSRNYKTTDDINKLGKRLLTNCGGYLTKTVIQASPLIESFDIQKPVDKVPLTMQSKRQKVFLLCGEHPRELIAQQSCFKYVEWLCTAGVRNMKEGPLDKNILKIILNANPTGKSYLEKFKTDSLKVMKRSNARDIDPNRNWDLGFLKWTHPLTVKKLKLDQTYGGESAFSEPEVVSIKNALAAFNPRVFLSMHAGMETLMMPYGFITDKVAEPFGQRMNDVLSKIQGKYCKNCKIGPLEDILKYTTGGNCLDYAFDCLRIPYAFAWEIFNGPASATGIEQFTPSGGITIGDLSKNWLNAINEATNLIWDNPEDGQRPRLNPLCNTGGTIAGAGGNTAAGVGAPRVGAAGVSAAGGNTAATRAGTSRKRKHK